MWKRKRGMLLGRSILPRWRYRDPIPDPFASNGVSAPADQGIAGGSGTAPPADIEPTSDNINQVNPADRPALDGGLGAAGGTGGAGGTAPPRQAPADPNQRAAVSGQTQTQPAGNDWQSIRDAAQALGYQVPSNIADDSTFLSHLIQQANTNRQADYYARLGQQLQPHAAGIQDYLRQQAQPQQAQERPAWEAPEFDERWVSLVDRDQATGLYVSKPGVPHDIAQKVNAFVEWKTKFDRNPAAVINGMVEDRARSISRETFQEQYGAAQRTQTVNSILSANAPWLYQNDASGRPIANPMTGQPSYSPVGTLYVQQVQALWNAGVRDPATQDRLAKDYVRGQYALAAQQQSANANGRNADPQNRQAANPPNVNPLQGLPPTQRRNTPGATEPDTTGQTLHEMLRAELAREGVTDADIMASIGNG